MPPSTITTSGTQAPLVASALGFASLPDPTVYLPYSSPQIITSSGTWRHPKPGFPISLTYSAIGGGGGGGGVGYGGGGGGGSGRITLMSTITVTQDITVTIGAGGTVGGGGGGGASVGATGGTTTFNAVSVAGGTGGSQSYEEGEDPVTHQFANGPANGGAGGFGGGGGYPTSATPNSGYKIGAGGGGLDFTGGGGCAGLGGTFPGALAGASTGGYARATDGSNTNWGYYNVDNDTFYGYTAYSGEPNGAKITNTGGGGGQASLLFPFFLNYGTGGRGGASGAAATAGKAGAVFIWYNRT